MEEIAIVLVLLLVFGFATYPFLPKVLGELRLYRCTTPDLDLKGRRAPVICTSSHQLDPTNRKTAAFGSEFTVAFYTFGEAGMQCYMASTRRGEIPIQPLSWCWPFVCDDDRRFMADRHAMATENSRKQCGNVRSSVP